MSENQYTLTEQKLISLLQYASVGIVEINESGTIVFLNLFGKVLLKPVFETNNLDDSNLFPILQLIAPSVKEKIENFREEKGLVVMNEVVSCFIPSPEGLKEKYLNFIVNKISPGCIVVSIDDITEKKIKEALMRQVQLDGAMEQGKFEIASGVLHDIGNAVVGFGSYLTRVKRIFDQNNPGTLQNLAVFFAEHQKNFTSVIGEVKAKALVDMLNGITQTQKISREEVSRAITEQLNIITHIQEILNIQRQYVSGQEAGKREPVNLKNIISDCLAMLFASFNKRGIVVYQSIQPDLPMLKGDRTQLMQVVLNLLKNSLEAIEISAAEKKISIQSYTKSDLLVLQVQDSGMGFDNSTAGRLFKRGFTTKGSGSGVGLYNCRTIIESHGGTINLTSEGPGKGASAVISFPV
jgi:signal transduction histidine kinase